MRLRKGLAAVLVALVSLIGLSSGASAAGVAITGLAFNDVNRNGARDEGEAPYSGHRIYLVTETGTAIAAATTDAAGNYRFDAVPPGQYTVEYAADSWWSIREEFAPTTTPNLRPQLHVTAVEGSTTIANFGWRPILRSTDPSQPITTYVAPSGLRAKSYNDAVSAREIAEQVARGELIGSEAASITVSFDLTKSAYTSSMLVHDGSAWTQFSATIYMPYLSWIDTGDKVLFHEYGHAWAEYHAHLIQQDDTFSGYLEARGLTGDSRLDSTYAWGRHELIADDYRQLFGTPSAAASVHMNADIAEAPDVVGLRDYLSATFRSSPTGDAAPAPELAIADLAMNPSPVKTTGTAAFTISTDALVTVRILDSKGRAIRTLASDLAMAAGTRSLVWDKRTDSGALVRKGSFTLVVDARDANGRTTNAVRPFRTA